MCQFGMGCVVDILLLRAEEEKLVSGHRMDVHRKAKIRKEKKEDV
jgi:hypothetical protein